MDGLLLVNKPIGITSFDVIRQLRRRTGFKKIGHAGTLDPLASGLMLLLFGTGCKQAMRLTKLDKRYVADIVLGANSSTGDNEGEKTTVSAYEPTWDEIRAAVARYIGEITQKPPIYSAIKINGQEAYKLARAGKEVDMPTRQVTVYELEILSYEYPRLQIDCRVSSGTYIRTLAEDIGRELGTGAYLGGLVRTEVAEYLLENALVLDEIADAAVVEQHIIQM